ncbi:MAG: hypothetical protein K2G70_03105 [Turicibacter sp.]|nr:hypothetical protein [Turicibacter sp.]
MQTVDDVLNSLKKSDRVKVILPNGIYFQGKRKRVQQDISHLHSNLSVSKTEISYVPLLFRINLCKETVIYLQ